MFRSYCEVALARPFSAAAIFSAISSCVSAAILGAYAHPATMALISACTLRPALPGPSHRHPAGLPFPRWSQIVVG